MIASDIFTLYINPGLCKLCKSEILSTILTLSLTTASLPLRLSIHAARTDRVHIAPVGFRLRVHKRVAVGLGCGCEQKARALLSGKTQHIVGAKCSALQRLDGQVKVMGDAVDAKWNM